MHRPVRVGDALPQSTLRYPTLDPNMPIITGLSLLRFNEVDALPLASDTGGLLRCLSGYSCLARLLNSNAMNLDTFLKQPCVQASEPLTCVGSDEDLEALMDAFLRTRFGFSGVQIRGG